MSGPLKRQLGSPALFAIVYTSVASAIYFALGVVAENALGLTPVVFLLGMTGQFGKLTGLEGFPTDWKTNTPAFIEFLRAHQCPSFLEYGEYPYVTSDEVKLALLIKAALAEMLGAPIAHKDLFCTRGVLTSCGSKILTGFKAPYDATVVARL